MKFYCDFVRQFGEERRQKQPDSCHPQLDAPSPQCTSSHESSSATELAPQRKVCLPIPLTLWLLPLPYGWRRKIPHLSRDPGQITRAFQDRLWLLQKYWVLWLQRGWWQVELRVSNTLENILQQLLENIMCCLFSLGLSVLANKTRSLSGTEAQRNFTYFNLGAHIKITESK